MTAPTAVPMPVEVPAPAIERYLYGLLSAARLVTEADRRWEAHGIVYSADSCGPGGGVWPSPCEVLQPGQVTVFTVALDKPSGGDQLFATVIGNAYGPTVPVAVSVDGGTAQPLLPGVRSAPFPVTAGSIATVSGTIAATGPYPACTNEADVAIPATANSATTQFSCIATIPEIDAADKTVANGLSLIGSPSFIVYEGLACISLTVDEAGERARRRLDLHEQYWVEREVDNTVLRDGVTVLGGGTAVPMARGVGLLEDAIAELYGGVGVIHVARELAAPMTHLQIVRRDGARLRSPLDNIYAFGAGYTTRAPNGDAAPAGQAWLYATGPVTARRSEVQTIEAFDQRKNTRIAVAERSYAITADCLRVAVLVSIPEA